MCIVLFQKISIPLPRKRPSTPGNSYPFCGWSTCTWVFPAFAHCFHLSLTSVFFFYLIICLPFQLCKGCWGVFLSSLWRNISCCFSLLFPWGTSAWVHSNISESWCPKSEETLLICRVWWVFVLLLIDVRLDYLSSNEKYLKSSCELQEAPVQTPGHLTRQPCGRLLASNIVSHSTLPKLHFWPYPPLGAKELSMQIAFSHI